MTVLDAQAVLALLLDEPAADRVQRLLRDGPSALAAVNRAEIVDQLLRRHGRLPADVWTALASLELAGVRTVTFDETLADLVGQLRHRHYNRNTSALSLADCAVLALAVSMGQRLATADPALAEAARREGLEVLALPDSRGRRP